MISIFIVVGFCHGRNVLEGHDDDDDNDDDGDDDDDDDDDDSI